jgi:Domain of unknown function (DUF4349)
MKRLDDSPIDPEVAASLDAIDATLAGEPVDPKYADLAELALLLSADRPACSAEFARSMDARVQRRFAPAPASTAPRQRRVWGWWAACGGGITAGAAALVILVSSLGSGGSSSSSSAAALNLTPTLTHGVTSSSSAATATATTPSAPTRSLKASPAQNVPAGPLAFSKAPSAGAASSTAALTPPQNNRKIIQSSQLALGVPPTRIDTVAQEVFDVIGQQNGIVNHSSVTASNSPGAYAEFQLSVPSVNLSRTMAELSRLRYATVSSRTDTTQDVNNQYVGDTRRLDEDQALRTSLLKQLANAVTTAQIASLTAQIHDVDARIAADQSTLKTLSHQIAYSQIQLTINAANIVPAAHQGGFTLRKAAHDAGRVLTVAAGVALITLAALVPIGLLAALAWWIAANVRRRRREQALDLA